MSHVAAAASTQQHNFLDPGASGNHLRAALARVGAQAHTHAHAAHQQLAVAARVDESADENVASSGGYAFIFALVFMMLCLMAAPIFYCVVLSHSSPEEYPEADDAHASPAAKVGAARPDAGEEPLPPEQGVIGGAYQLPAGVRAKSPRLAVTLAIVATSTPPEDAAVVQDIVREGDTLVGDGIAGDEPERGMPGAESTTLAETSTTAVAEAKAPSGHAVADEASITPVVEATPPPAAAEGAEPATAAEPEAPSAQTVADEPPDTAAEVTPLQPAATKVVEAAEAAESAETAEAAEAAETATPAQPEAASTHAAPDEAPAAADTAPAAVDEAPAAAAEETPSQLTAAVAAEPASLAEIEIFNENAAVDGAVPGAQTAGASKDDDPSPSSRGAASGAAKRKGKKGKKP